jgi:hypothetical protein
MTYAQLQAGDLKCLTLGVERAFYGVFNGFLVFESPSSKGIFSTTREYVDNTKDWVYPIPPKKKIPDAVKVGDYFALNYNVHTYKIVSISYDRSEVRIETGIGNLVTLTDEEISNGKWFTCRFTEIK